MSTLEAGPAPENPRKKASTWEAVGAGLSLIYFQ
jgi:hypothetical protein